MENQKTVAIFPGTFDPVHLGHIDILTQTAQTFGQVIWAVLRNPVKQPKFPLPVRLEMMGVVSAQLPNVRIETFDGLLVDAARNFGATHIVRSLRMHMDFDYEFNMTLINRTLAPELITIYIPAMQEHFHISSTTIRELLAFGRDVSGLVPACIHELISR